MSIIVPSNMHTLFVSYINLLTFKFVANACALFTHIPYEFFRNEIIVSYYTDVIMSAMASQITSLASVYSAVSSGVDQRKHQSSASLVFVRGIHQEPVNSPHKVPVTRKMFPFDDVIMGNLKNIGNTGTMPTITKHTKARIMCLLLVEHMGA